MVALSQKAINAAVLGAEFDPATVALVARMSVKPTAARLVLINNLVTALKLAGVWAKLDVFYVLAAHDAQAARLNWKAATFDLTAVNSPAFATDRGYTGGSTKYLDTGFNPTTAPTPNFVQNSASVGIWSRTAGQQAGIAMGNNSSALELYTRWTDDRGFARVNSTGAHATGDPVTDGSGLFIGSRTASNLTTLSRNNAALATTPDVAAAPNNSTLRVLTSAANYWGGEAAAALAGAGLIAAERNAAYAALAAYMTAVGA